MDFYQQNISNDLKSLLTYYPASCPVIGLLFAVAPVLVVYINIYSIGLIKSLLNFHKKIFHGENSMCKFHCRSRLSRYIADKFKEKWPIQLSPTNNILQTLSAIALAFIMLVETIDTEEYSKSY